MFHSFISHQRCGVKLKDDMLQEDKQVGRPFPQLFYTGEVGLVVHRLGAGAKYQTELSQAANERGPWHPLVITHIIHEIILKVLVFSPDDAHGCV